MKKINAKGRYVNMEDPRELAKAGLRIHVCVVQYFTSPSAAKAFFTQQKFSYQTWLLRN
jgi:hypothetical protein